MLPNSGPGRGKTVSVHCQRFPVRHVEVLEVEKIERGRARLHFRTIGSSHFKTAGNSVNYRSTTIDLKIMLKHKNLLRLVGMGTFLT